MTSRSYVAPKRLSLEQTLGHNLTLVLFEISHIPIGCDKATTKKVGLFARQVECKTSEQLGYWW